MALSFLQLEAIWQQAGGSVSLAPSMAAIALAESGGNPDAINPEACRDEANAGQPCNVSSTGDYSIGLWQINYYGGLFLGRVAAYGPPGALFDPLANARAAVDIAGNGSGRTAWTTYGGASYLAYLAAGSGGGGGSGGPAGTSGPVGVTQKRHIVTAPAGPEGPSTADDTHLTKAWHTLVGAVKDTMQHRADLANQASRGYKRTVRQLTRR